MIVATAGHIDHGKTRLVKALTGIETDRLPEERKRGISIDLGFASLANPEGPLIGFVDVPGHERFVRNMLAGVCGIDFALLVVAADDGVMPQTLEHASILDLLGVSRGAVVISKTDRVAAARVQEVAREVGELLAGTALENCPILPVSVPGGEGIAELRALLLREAATEMPRFVEGEHFRLAIDRAFIVAGSGTVVTGTVYSGAVVVGDKLTLSGVGTPVRVRGIQVHGCSATRAIAGQRCALNLAGADVASASRGEWVLDAAIHAPTHQFDARVAVLSSEAALSHWTPVHVHIGSACVMARVALARAGSIAPGAQGIAQLRFDRSLVAMRGDKFILRDQGSTRTIGGGTVIDPCAPPAGRRDPARLKRLQALEARQPEDVLAQLVSVDEHGVDLDRFERTINATPDRAAAIVAKAGVVILGRAPRLAVSTTAHGRLLESIVATLEEAHRRKPDAGGHEMEAVRRALQAPPQTDVFHELVRELVRRERVRMNGSQLRLRGFVPEVRSADTMLWARIGPALEASGFTPPTVHDLASRLELDEPAVLDLLHRRAKAGELVKVAPDRFYPRATLAALASIARDTAASSPAGLFTARQFRDAIGAGRGAAIRVLECLDALGITQRNGDARRFRGDVESVLGRATPPHDEQEVA